MARQKRERDRLSPEELGGVRDTYFEPGLPYLWTLGFGWAIVGFYVRRESGLFVVVQHANHFHDAGKHYGLIAREGIDKQSAWRYEGLDLVNLASCQKVQEYHAGVPRGPLG